MVKSTISDICECGEECTTCTIQYNQVSYVYDVTCTNCNTGFYAEKE